jgi:hypothetical protein
MLWKNKKPPTIATIAPVASTACSCASAKILGSTSKLTTPSKTPAVKLSGERVDDMVAKTVDHGRAI